MYYNDDDNEVKCPICDSHSIASVAKKKGFGIGKALIGAALIGPVGLIGGAIGSQKTKVTCVCLKCGHEWNPQSKW